MNIATYQFHHADLKKIFPYRLDRTLISWVEHGLITPLKDARQGNRRTYSYKNLIEFAIVDKLLNFSIPIATVRKIVTSPTVQAALGENLPTFYVCVTAQEVVYPGKAEPDFRFHSVVLRHDEFENLKTILSEITIVLDLAPIVGALQADVKTFCFT